MTRPDLEAIDRRVEAATEEPWNDCGSAGITQTKHLTRDVWRIPKGIEDVTFMAHARTDVPAMSAYIKALEKSLKELEETISTNIMHVKLSALEKQLGVALDGLQKIWEHDDSGLAAYNLSRKAFVEIEKLRREGGK